jgi:hypothetical protein
MVFRPCHSLHVRPRHVQMTVSQSRGVSCVPISIAGCNVPAPLYVCAMVDELELENPNKSREFTPSSLRLECNSIMGIFISV